MGLRNNALQTGEVVNNIQIGDSARWDISPAVSGDTTAQIEHIIIKPLDVGLETSMVVTTDRRTYHIRLKATRDQYLPQVSFIYPESSDQLWNAWQKKATALKEDRQAQTLPQEQGGEYLGDLDFSYDISGQAPWKPVRVYNDGKKTIIQMPSEMKQTEAPTLLVRRGSGNEEQQVMVNYRIQNNRYIVDTVFSKAILIAGVGSAQEKITLTKER